MNVIRAASPFLSGVIGGAALITGLLIAWHSTGAIRSGDWQYFAAQFIAAACIGIGGVLVILNGMELYK